MINYKDSETENNFFAEIEKKIVKKITFFFRSVFLTFKTITFFYAMWLFSEIYRKVIIKKSLFFRTPASLLSYYLYYHIDFLYYLLQKLYQVRIKTMQIQNNFLNVTKQTKINFKNLGFFQNKVSDKFFILFFYKKNYFIHLFFIQLNFLKIDREYSERQLHCHFELWKLICGIWFR